jgi:predicted nucleic acid-binding protein
VSVTALDATVVVAATLTWHEAHARSVRAIEAAHGDSSRTIVPRPALVQAYSVMTRLPRGYRVAPERAVELLEGLVLRREDPRTSRQPDAGRLLRAAAAAGVAGGAIHDYEILVTAASVGATRLLTLDPDDFLRFGDHGVEIVVP